MISSNTRTLNPEFAEKLRALGNLAGWTIIEHRPECMNTVGTIEYVGLNGDGSLGIVWHDERKLNRDTLFSSRSWSCEIIAGIIFFKRSSADSGDFDIPRVECDMYTIVQTMKRVGESDMDFFMRTNHVCKKTKQSAPWCDICGRLLGGF